MAKVGSPRQLIEWLSTVPQDGKYEVREKRGSRSLTQNAYYWKLLSELAWELGISRSEAHFKMLRDYGVCDVFLLRDDVEPSWYFKYFDEVDAGLIKGARYRRVTAYKRSSEMDSKEFSRLIDGLRLECEQQGIPFMTPEEVSRLRFEQPG